MTDTKISNTIVIDAEIYFIDYDGASTILLTRQYDCCNLVNVTLFCNSSISRWGKRVQLGTLLKYSLDIIRNIDLSDMKDGLCKIFKDKKIDLRIKPTYMLSQYGQADLIVAMAKHYREEQKPFKNGKVFPQLLNFIKEYIHVIQYESSGS